MSDEETKGDWIAQKLVHHIEKINGMAGAEVIDQVLTDSAEDCLKARGVLKTALEKDAESWSDYWGSRLQDFAVHVTSQPTSIGAAEQSGLKFGTLTEVTTWPVQVGSETGPSALQPSSPP